MSPQPVVIEAEARTADLVRLWNSAVGNEFPLDERLLRQQLRLDTDPRRCCAFINPDGSMAAAALVKRAARPGPSGKVPETGYLSLLVVDARHRRAGLATALMADARTWLSSLGATTMRFGGDHYHLLPGRPLESGNGYEALSAFTKAQGFVGEHEEYDLQADLGVTALPGANSVAEAAHEGGRYRFRPYQPVERDAVVAFMSRNFPGRWTHEAAEAIDAGMKPCDLMLAVDSTDGAIVGFSRIYDEASTILGPGVYWRGLMGKHPGGLGPIGVDATRRGAGLGLGLLSRCVDELRSRGVGTMVIDWTDLVDFYGKLGFTIWKRYEPMSAATRRP